MTIGTLSIKSGPRLKSIVQLMSSGIPLALAYIIDRMATATTRKIMERTPKMDENWRLLMSFIKDNGSMIVPQDIVMSTHLCAKILCIPKQSSPSGVIMSPSVTRYATEMPKQKIKILTSTKIVIYGQQRSRDK
ncbi:unnamed protein product [Phytophthora lilii]|uniref:Unnamed protein product n=1 Tax=Phytophthora lilii TaxID=2077276 RepID=A0A9W6U3Q6_9STRA|nr:unnamed protein product [Phytophthora lilii]